MTPVNQNTVAYCSGDGKIHASLADFAGLTARHDFVEYLQTNSAVLYGDWYQLPSDKALENASQEVLKLKGNVYNLIYDGTRPTSREPVYKFIVSYIANDGSVKANVSDFADLETRKKFQNWLYGAEMQGQTYGDWIQLHSIEAANNAIYFAIGLGGHTYGRPW